MLTFIRRILLIWIFISLHSPLLASSPIPPAMKANAEEAIKSCEQIYQKIQGLRARFDSVKKPGLFASDKAKIAYKNLEVSKKAFDIQFAEFARFTNEKIGIRTAQTLEELRDRVAAYSSNCKRFSSGIEGFVEWATTGKGPVGFDVTYKDWQEDARKQMK